MADSAIPASNVTAWEDLSSDAMEREIALYVTQRIAIRNNALVSLSLSASWSKEELPHSPQKMVQEQEEENETKREVLVRLKVSRVISLDSDISHGRE